MAKKKRKTLPQNFKELIKAGDMEALKAVFDDCELNAYGGYDKETALHFHSVPNELVRWLVEQGLDINTPSAIYRRTPLYEHATYGDSTVELLLDLGANIEATSYDDKTPLYMAAGYYRVDTVRLLIERGANIHAKSRGGQTPLAYALATCRGIQICGMAEIAAILLSAGAKITPDMTDSVRRIGEDFEFHREGFNKELLAGVDIALSRLYELFGVEPVPRRHIHDGLSPIKVKDGDWKEQFAELWEYLIPSSGPAKTVQGEVVRIAGRVRDELYRNGGANWNADYRKMLNDLPKHFASGTAFSPEELAETKALLSSIHAKGDDEDAAINRLCELAVKWVSANPQPMPLPKPDYRH